MDFDKKISIDSLDLLVSFYDDLDEFNDGLERLLKKHRRCGKTFRCDCNG